MAIIAQAVQHRQLAEGLITRAGKLLAQVEDQKTGDVDQMQTDLQSITAMSTLASAHIALASYYRSA